MDADERGSEAMSKQRWYKPTVRAALIVAGIVALIISIALPSLHRTRYLSGRQPCPSSLSRIGMALLLYANDNGLRYPSDLNALVSTDGLPAEVLRCPKSSGKPAYIFVAGGMHLSDLDEFTVVCFEPQQNHEGDGSNVLYGDGHVNWVVREIADEIRTRAETGTRPLRLQREPAGVSSTTQSER